MQELSVAATHRRRKARVWAGLALAGATAALTVGVGCTDHLQQLADFLDAAPLQGEEHGPCGPEMSCNPGLTCQSNVCEKPTDAGQTPTVDAGMPSDASLSDGPADASDMDAQSSDAGDGGDLVTSASVYNDLGKRPGIANVVKLIFEGANGVLADPQLASYFLIRTGGPGGAPSLTVIEDCFTQFMAHSAGGPETYPYTSMLDGGPTFACRDIAAAHAGLHAAAGAFDKFIVIWANALSTFAVSASDIQALSVPFFATKPKIVDPTRVQQQAEAGVDAGKVFGAKCTDVDGGASTAPGCTNP